MKTSRFLIIIFAVFMSSCGALPRKVPLISKKGDIESILGIQLSDINSNDTCYVRKIDGFTTYSFYLKVSDGEFKKNFEPLIQNMVGSSNASPLEERFQNVDSIGKRAATLFDSYYKNETWKQNIQYESIDMAIGKRNDGWYDIFLIATKPVP